MRERDKDRGEEVNKPVDTLRDGALKVSIFRNRGEERDTYAMVPGRIYTDKDSGKVRETSSLGGSEPLRMAHLLTKGHDLVAQLRKEAKQNRSPRQRNRDDDRER